MPSDLTINGAEVLRGSVSMPRVGRWTADLLVNHGDEVTGRVTLASADGSLRLTGAVKRSGEYEEVGHVRALGGNGGLDGEAPPVYYRSVPLGLPLRALLAAVGETLSSTTDPGVTNAFLERWVRERGPGGVALSALADAAGATWRMLDDGTVWLGTDTYPTVDVDHELVGAAPAEHRVTIATEQIPGALRAGTTFRGQRVAFVEYRLAPRAVTTQVWFERPGSNGHPVLGPLHGIVRAALRETRFHASYPAQVVSQAADGTLGVRLDDPAMPHMDGVPLRALAPGVRIVCDPGVRVRVEFEAGDPSKPVASLFETDSSGLYPVAHEQSKVDEHFHKASQGTMYAGPFPCAGTTDNTGAGTTLPCAPLAASQVGISIGQGFQKLKVPQ